MSLRTARYVIASCDGCGPGWWANDPACGAVSPHFLSEMCAREQLGADYGWVIRHRLFRPTSTSPCSATTPRTPHDRARVAGSADRVAVYWLRRPGPRSHRRAQRAAAVRLLVPATWPDREEAA